MLRKRNRNLKGRVREKVKQTGVRREGREKGTEIKDMGFGWFHDIFFFLKRYRRQILTPLKLGW